MATLSELEHAVYEAHGAFMLADALLQQALKSEPMQVVVFLNKAYADAFDKHQQASEALENTLPEVAESAPALTDPFEIPELTGPWIGMPAAVEPTDLLTDYKQVA